MLLMSSTSPNYISGTHTMILRFESIVPFGTQTQWSMPTDFFFSLLAYPVIVVTLFRLCMFFYVLHIEIFRDSSIEIRRATGSIDSVGIYRWRQIRLNFLGTPIWPFHRLIVWIGKQCEHRSFLTHILWREMIYVVVVFVENQAKVSFLP